MNYPILNQGNKIGGESECAGFAILGALIRMKPDTDYVKIGKEIIDEDGNSMGFMNAMSWFCKKGYIKGYRKCLYTPFMSKKSPIITTIQFTDWDKTGIAPYLLTFKPKGSGGSHVVCIDSPGKFVNSWGLSFGDKGYFYFTPDQVKKFGQCFLITI